MAVRKRRSSTSSSTRAAAAPGDTPRDVVTISVRSGAGFLQQWVSSADGDLSDDQADAHKFIIDDARTLHNELQQSFKDASLHLVGNEGTVDPS